MARHERSVLTSEWYVVPVSVDCTGCGAQTRSAGIIVGPTSLTNEANFDLDSDVLKKAWDPLEAFGLVEKLSGRTENVERFITKRYHSAFAMTDCPPSAPMAQI